MDLEVPISWPWFDFGISSWLGNCKHNMWPASRVQQWRRRNRPSDCPWGMQESRWQVSWPYCSQEQWPLEEGSMWQIWFSPLRKLQEQRGQVNMLLRVLFKQIPAGLTYFWRGKTIVFFSPLCAFNTQFQLSHQLAKATLNNNSFDTESELHVLLKKTTRKANVLQQGLQASPPLLNKISLSLHISTSSWICRL